MVKVRKMYIPWHFLSWLPWQPESSATGILRITKKINTRYSHFDKIDNSSAQVCEKVSRMKCVIAFSQEEIRSLHSS